MKEGGRDGRGQVSYTRWLPSLGLWLAQTPADGRYERNLNPNDATGGGSDRQKRRMRPPFS